MLKIERVDYSWEDEYGSIHIDVQYQLWDTEAAVNPLYTSRNSSNGCVTHALSIADKVYDEPKEYSIFRYKGTYYKAVYKPGPKLFSLSKEDVEKWMLSSAKEHDKKILALTAEFAREQKILNKVLRKMSGL